MNEGNTMLELMNRQAEGRRRNRPRKESTMARTWADEEMERLNSIGRDNWTEDDWEAYHYIQNARAEADYYDSLD